MRNEVSPARRGPDPNALDWDEPQVSGDRGELAAAYLDKLDPVAPGYVSRATTDRARPRTTSAPQSRDHGRTVSHCCSPWCPAPNEEHCQARIRYANGCELPGLERVDDPDHDPAARGSGGQTLSTGYLDSAA